MKKLYAYGLVLRPIGPMCQPKGFYDWRQDSDMKFKLPSGEYVWTVIWYDRMLSDDELKEYEMIRLESEDK